MSPNPLQTEGRVPDLRKAKPTKDRGRLADTMGRKANGAVNTADYPHVQRVVAQG